MEALAPTLALFGLFVFGGLATYRISERRHRARWRALGHRRAPEPLRRTALWSIYMGQMAVPGGALGLLGLFFGGLGLVSIPGMILAIRIWRLGYALLRGDARAAQQARDLARFAIVLNIVAVTVGFALLLVDGGELALVTAVLTVYGAVSFAHAKAMLRCAELLEAAVRRTQPLGAEIEPAPQARA